MKFVGSCTQLIPQEVSLNSNLVNNSHYSPIIFIIKNWKNKNKKISGVFCLLLYIYY